MSRKTPKKNPREGVDEYGRTKIHYAADEGDVEFIKTCIEEGVNLNAQDDNGWPPLHFAAQGNRFEAIDLLLANQGDPNLHDHHGNGPLWTATLNAEASLKAWNPSSGQGLTLFIEPSWSQSLRHGHNHSTCLRHGLRKVCQTGHLTCLFDS